MANDQEEESVAVTSTIPPKDYTHYIYAPVYTGLTGASVGTAIGALRGQSSLMYALHLGIGYATFGGTFSSTLFAMGRIRGVEDRANWVAAGAMAGSVTSYITAGPKKVVGGMVFFGGIGLIAESVCSLISDSITEYKQTRASTRLADNSRRRE